MGGFRKKPPFEEIPNGQTAKNLDGVGLQIASQEKIGITELGRYNMASKTISSADSLQRA